MVFTYDSGFVVLSIAVAIFGAFTGLVMLTGIKDVSAAEARLRICLGAFGIGGGIWSMHFIAMLAVKLPITLSYDVTQTILSALIAVCGTALALEIVSSQMFGRMSLPLSALFLGLGIGGMHYLGMNAIRGNCILQYSWLGIALSIVIAIQASAVALWFAFRQRGVYDTFIGAIALGFAVALMHYSAMESTRFLPDEAFAGITGLLISEKYMALAVAATIYSVCCFCLFVFSLLTLRKRRRHAG